MKKKTKVKNNQRICGDCIHCCACSSWCCQNLYETDATSCCNYEKQLTNIKLLKLIEKLGIDNGGLKIWTIGVKE